MSAAAVCTPPPGELGDVDVDADEAALLFVLAELSRMGLPGNSGSSAVRVNRIALLEQVKAAASAAQSGEMVQFAVAQVAEQREADVHPRQLGRGIADQIALACRISPSAGSSRLTVARSLWFDLPATFTVHRAGQVSDWVATLVCRETSHLDAAARRQVDAQLAATDLGSLSPHRAQMTARRLAQVADPAAAVQRARIAETERRVTIRPAPDTMAILTATLPAVQAIAAWAALRRETDTVIGTGDVRGRGQIMADTLVQRLTGQTTAGDVTVEVGLVMPLESLVDPDSGPPVELTGYGPIPAGLARDLLAHTHGSLFLRRLFTNPTGQLIDVDERRRRFPAAVAQLILARDQRCRNPYCDAPIRHLDHITRHIDLGPTTIGNGRGACERCNYTHELPGWRIRVIHDGLHGRPHTVETTTPTGHRYLSQAPRPP